MDYNFFEYSGINSRASTDMICQVSHEITGTTFGAVHLTSFSSIVKSSWNYGLINK